MSRKVTETAILNGEKVSFRPSLIENEVRIRG